MISPKKNAKDAIFLTICVMGTAAILSSTMSKSPGLNNYATYLGTPPEWMGIVGAASTIPGILVSLPAASLSDIFGRKRFLFVAGLVFASAPFLYFLLITGEWWQLVLVRFYHGFATAIFVPVAEASIVEAFPSKRGERTSLFSSATYVGRVAAPILGGTILYLTSPDMANPDFHLLYLGVAIAGVTALVVALPFLLERKGRAAVEQHVRTGKIAGRMYRGWKEIIGIPGVVIVCLVQASQYYAFGAVEFYLQGYLNFLKFSWLSTGIVMASLVAIPIVGKPYMGRISDKVGRRSPIIVGCAVSAFPLMAIPFVSEFWMLLMLAVAYGLGFAAVTAATPALTSELAPKESVGAAMGFLATVMDVGQTLGTIVSGLIFATSLKYAGIFPALAIVLLLSCLIFAVSKVDRVR